MSAIFMIVLLYEMSLLYILVIMDMKYKSDVSRMRKPRTHHVAVAGVCTRTPIGIKLRSS